MRKSSITNFSTKTILPSATFRLRREYCATTLRRRRAAILCDVDATLVVCHLTRVVRPKRHVLFKWRLRSELLVRVFSRAQNDVAAVKCRGKHAFVWPGNFNSWTQLPGSSHFSSEKIRCQKLPLVRHDAIDGCLQRSLREELDHRYLNKDVAGLKNHPITTEGLAAYIYERVNADDAVASCPFARARRFFRRSVE